jgi:hypothetical protein
MDKKLLDHPSSYGGVSRCGEERMKYSLISVFFFRFFSDDVHKEIWYLTGPFNRAHLPAPVTQICGALTGSVHGPAKPSIHFIAGMERGEEPKQREQKSSHRGGGDVVHKWVGSSWA